MIENEPAHRRQPEPEPKSKPDPAPSSREPRAAMTRREFARRAATTALAPAALALVPAATSAAAQAPAPSAKPSAATPAPVQVAPNPDLPKLTPEGQAEADARAQSILSQYGSRLSDDQKADIRRLCAWAQPPLDRLRGYHLQNSDGEALYLKPLVEREKKTPPTAPSPTKKKDS
jgi:hypothetical protein